MNDEETTVQGRRPETLEPRVAKLELGMERLTEDVKDLANVVRIQGQTVEQEIQKLVVAVTQAAGPKKTDWGTIIAGMGLVLAIGSAVFWPLNQKTDYMMQNIATIQQKVEAHEKMDNHPVGAALVQRLEGQLQSHIENNQREFKQHVDQDNAELEQMRKHFNEVIAVQKDLLETEMKAKDDLMMAYANKISDHVIVLQSLREKEMDRERAELDQWRQKAMGLSSPNAVVPLVTREPDAKK